MTALPQQDNVTGAEQQQQPAAPRRRSLTAQQSPHGPSGQGSLHHTGLQSKAAQTVMQQRQAYLRPAHPGNAMPKRAGT